jgi:hypothetical protein
MIRKGTIIINTEAGIDLPAGKRYVTTEDHNDRTVFLDDAGYSRSRPLEYSIIIGHIDDVVTAPVTTLKDIHGQSVSSGDYVAYAYATGSLAVFEVLSINGPHGLALCRNVVNNFTTTLGVFDERALKLKDYNK